MRQPLRRSGRQNEPLHDGLGWTASRRWPGRSLLVCRCKACRCRYTHVVAAQQEPKRPDFVSRRFPVSAGAELAAFDYRCHLFDKGPRQAADATNARGRAGSPPVDNGQVRPPPCAAEGGVGSALDHAPCREGGSIRRPPGGYRVLVCAPLRTLHVDGGQGCRQQLSARGRHAHAAAYLDSRRLGIRPSCPPVRPHTRCSPRLAGLPLRDPTTLPPLQREPASPRRRIARGRLVKPRRTTQTLHNPTKRHLAQPGAGRRQALSSQAVCVCLHCCRRRRPSQIPDATLQHAAWPSTAALPSDSPIGYGPYSWPRIPSCWTPHATVWLSRAHIRFAPVRFPL